MTVILIQDKYGYNGVTGGKTTVIEVPAKMSDIQVFEIWLRCQSVLLESNCNQQGIEFVDALDWLKNNWTYTTHEVESLTD